MGTRGTCSDVDVIVIAIRVMLALVWRHRTGSIVGRQVAEERILDDRLERSRRPGGENQAMLQATDQHERPQVERLTVGTCDISFI